MHHTLLATLGIQPGETVALVGAGGKTTTLQRLVAEIRAAGRTVLTTSTVHMFELKGGAPHAFVVEPDPARLRADLPGLLAEWGHVRVAGERLRADKIRGLAPEVVAALRETPGLDYLLVEADGARHRSLKAPAAHEPVLPPGVDRVLLVVGLDILGQPLSEATVHRPAEVAALTGLADGRPDHGRSGRRRADQPHRWSERHIPPDGGLGDRHQVHPGAQPSGGRTRCRAAAQRPASAASSCSAPPPSPAWPMCRWSC